jgi:two-component system sensor histidine kinase ChvG
MASVTATAKPERARPARARRRIVAPPSRVGRLIVVLNLIGLALLVAGALLLNQLGQRLVQARIESLRTEGQLIANVLDQTATEGDDRGPALKADDASNILQSLAIPRTERVRIFAANGQMIADSYVATDRIESFPLPPARKPGETPFAFPGFSPAPRSSEAGEKALQREIAVAQGGDSTWGVRPSDSGGGRVASVSIPIARVRDVVGVLTLESGDVDRIIGAEWVALVPFIAVAVLVNLVSSFAMTQLIAQPVRRLSDAADSVRLSQARAIALPDIAARRDELGDLARSLEDMTHTLSDRMEAIERFAADVAHEIRNPLTSVRSAVETLELVKDQKARDRLLAILKQDVTRLDRLITDISNASRLDAELAREPTRPIALSRVLREIVGLYEEVRREKDPHVRLNVEGDGVTVQGREGPLSQVFRNVIDNARSFSKPGGEVRVSLSRERNQAVVRVDDDGPGMPPENLETVFERFYTTRPPGTAFGGNSGLGLSIARQIVEAHGGTIRAENRGDGQGGVAGARFTVTLPAARTSA